jgi:hypothetical protein
LGPDGHFDAEVLASFVDGVAELPAETRAAMEAHLAACSSCRGALAELRIVVAALSALPEIEPRRSFALTPAMAESRELAQTVPAAARETGAPIDMRQTTAWHERQMRAMRWATVAAAILFVFVLSADITSNRFFAEPAERDSSVMLDQGSDPSGASAPDAFVAPQPGTAAEDAAGTTGEIRTTSGEPQPSATPASASVEAPPMATAAAAAAAPTEATEDLQQVTVEDDDTEAQESTQFQDGSSEDSMLMAAEEDRRSMSTSRHYWRLAQFGLAMLIVWLLAAMIALPRIRQGDRRR